jgi:hypothetical protein
MEIAEIIASIDREIAQLKQARALLAGGSGRTYRKQAATPTKSAAIVPAARGARRRKRKLTPEGRRRIVEAQKHRWEAQRKASAAAQK